MASHAAMSKGNRKLATYGKSSHRHTTNSFDFPTSAEPSEDELQSGPTLSSPLTKSPSARAGQGTETFGSQVTKQSGSVSSFSSTVPAKPISNAKEASEMDMFDVPSSEDEAEAASPLKPALKRRKVPGSDKSGTLTQAGEKPSAQKASRLSNFVSKPSSLTARKLPSKITPNKLNAGLPPSHRGGATPGSEGAKRRIEEDKATPTEPLSKQTPLVNSKSLLPAQEFRQEPRSTSRPRSIVSSKKGDESSLREPRTPPIVRRDTNCSNTDAGQDSQQRNAFTFMSPSGLDFLSLDISENAEEHLQVRNTTEVKSRPATVLRTKIKDRLTKRNGDSHSDSDGDYLMLQAETATDVTLSLPTFESSSNKSEASHELIDASQLDSVPAPRIPIGASPRNTYAARRRTFRKDENASEDDIFASLTESNDAPSTGARRIRIDVPTKASQENRKDTSAFDISDDDESGGLRNIHELREAGASARMTGETEAIMDEVESENTSTRRYGLLELLDKLRTKPFKDALGASGLDGRLIGRISTEVDTLSSTLLSMALLQIMSGQASSQALLQLTKPAIFVFLEPLITQTQSLRLVAKDRKSNLTKALQRAIEQECKLFIQTSVWKFGEPTEVSAQIIALHLLELLVRYRRNSGESGEILSPSMTELLVTVLADALPSSADTSMVGFRVTLSILEAATLGNSPSLQASGGWRERLLEQVVDILLSAFEWSPTEHAQDTSLVLRLAINTTNGDASACSRLARHKVLDKITDMIEAHFRNISEAENSSQVSVLDNLILALGLSINLAEHSGAARKVFAQATGEDLSPLDRLLGVFSSRWVQAFEVTSEEGSRESVPLGYLAVLLAFVAIDPEIRTYIASRTEGGSLRHLLVALDAFLSYHRKIAEDLHGGDDRVGDKTHFVDRVQAVLDELKRDESQMQ